MTPRVTQKPYITTATAKATTPAQFTIVGTLTSRPANGSRRSLKQCRAGERGGRKYEVMEECEHAAVVGR